MKLSHGSFIFLQIIPTQNPSETARISSKGEISKEILSFVRFALEKAGEKKYNIREHE